MYMLQQGVLNFAGRCEIDYLDRIQYLTRVQTFWKRDTDRRFSTFCARLLISHDLALAQHTSIVAFGSGREVRSRFGF